MELPLLTSVLPEGWNLPSYLAAVVQIACIAPLIYTVIHKGIKSIKLSIPPLIVGFLVLGCICQSGLVFAWDKTSVLFGEQRSWPLYLLLFGLAVVNAISNVLFMPFMAQFHPAYLNAYFIGMGFSSLIPSILSLIQGTSNYECDSNGSPNYFPPRFSVQVFFGVISAWTILATAAFLILYKSGAHKHTKSEKKVHEGTPLTNNPATISVTQSSDSQYNGTGAPTVDTIVVDPLELENCEKKSISNKSEAIDYITGGEYLILLLATATVNAQMNGVIPSIQSYAALPYSQDTYHYGLALANLISPVVSFLPFLVTIRRISVLAGLTVVSSILTGFIVYLAALSPSPVFGSYQWGSAVSIVSVLTAAAIQSYLRVVFATILREGHQSESRLFWCGVFIQIGSFIGSAVMFPLVNVFHLFTTAPPCRQ